MPKTQELRKTVARVLPARETLEGAGVVIHRALPQLGADPELMDPWLMLDDVDLPASDEPAFPRHPHRGQEIVTLIVGGASSHSDSRGNQVVVEAGGLQRIRAGSGIWHSEDTVPGRGLRGLQMWINLPLAEKSKPPEYQMLQKSQIPVERFAGGQLRRLAGQGGAAPLATPALYWEIRLDPGASWSVEKLPQGWQGWAYALEGSGSLLDHRLDRGHIALLQGEGGVAAQAGAQGLLFILALGQPLRQPIKWSGPFVD
jgi:redox-sensitive bicupin YhaK (pirin superfamily)